jgi:nicotinate phosphoribosyltransferase
MDDVVVPEDEDWVILHGDVGPPRRPRPRATPAGGGHAGPPALLLDLYELTMAQSYFEWGMAAPATFSLFARHLPAGWGYVLAAGLDDALAYLEELAFAPRELAYLRTTGLFTEDFLRSLGRLRFTGAVPPFGNLYGLPVYVDRTLAAEVVIVCQAGTHTDTVSLRLADFERLVRPVVADFALPA